MVDAERLRRVLQGVTDDVATLRGYAGRGPADVLADPASLGHVKYLFVTAIEGCIDAAQHICSSEGWGPPETNADAVLTLARHGTLDDDLATVVAAACRFRNLLVPRYALIDDSRVVENLNRLDDVDAYVAALAELTEDQC